MRLRRGERQHLGQGDGLADEAAEGVGLRQRLTVELVDPRLRTVGRDDDQGAMLIVSLSHGWREVEQRRTAGDADDDGLVQGLCHAEGIEAGRALIGDGPARDVGTLVQVMDDGGIAAAWADDGVTDAVGHEQRREYVDVLLVAKHLINLRFDDLRCTIYLLFEYFII